MNPFLTYLRRLQPADLILPAGAALVSAGVQKLVDREDHARRRLVALAELVDVHRGALTAAGVELPAELEHDEEHPLDVDFAVQTLLRRLPEPDKRITENPNPEKPRRRIRTIAGVLGLAVGVGAGLVWANARGWLQGVQEVTDANRAVREAVDARRMEGDGEWGGDRCTTCGRAAAWFRDGQVWLHVSPATGEQYAMTHDVTLPPAINETSPRPVELTVDPAEACGWPGCEWTSDPSRSRMAQRTAAAVHRNECVCRPAGARVKD